jgi:hypothetical protein
MGYGVNSKTIHALFHPEPGGCQDFREYLRILKVEVGLSNNEFVEVELLTFFLPFPGRTSKNADL